MAVGAFKNCLFTNQCVPSSVADIPPQRGQLILLFPSFSDSSPVEGSSCGHHPVQEALPTEHLCRTVNLIPPFKRIGPEPSYLWELADAVCRRYLTQTGPHPVGVHSCRKAHQSLAGPSGSSHRWQLTLCPRQFACLLSRRGRFLPLSSILCAGSNEDIPALLRGCHPDWIEMN